MIEDHNFIKLGTLPADRFPVRVVIKTNYGIWL